MTPHHEKSIAFDERMPQRVHVALCNYIARHMRPGQCQRDLTVTRRFFATESDLDVDAAIDWLDDHHASCDCEVVLNTVPDSAHVVM